MGYFTQILFAGLFGALALTGQSEEPSPAKSNQQPLAINPIQRATTVDFENEILPILKANCLACHNQTTAKGELVLETPQMILRGGETGSAVVPGRSMESLLLQLASHQARPRMPPKENKVAAVELTPNELGLIKLWIDQGAQGEVRAAQPVEWRRVPEALKPIYAVALTRDGQFAACGRANQIFVYHIPSRQLVARLSDPELLGSPLYQGRGAAHHDLVNSLDFSPDGLLLASGGYREVKIWRRPRSVKKNTFSVASPGSIRSVAVSDNGLLLAVGETNGAITLWDLPSQKQVRALGGHEKAVLNVAFSPDGSKVLSSSADQTIRIWNLANGGLLFQTNVAAEVSAVVWLGEKEFASGGGDNSVRIWQIPASTNESLVLLRKLDGHSQPVTDLLATRFSGEELISGSADGLLRIWNASTGQFVRQIEQSNAVSVLAAQRDGSRIVSAELTKGAKLWDGRSGKLVATLQGNPYLRENVDHLQREIAFAATEITYSKTNLQAAEALHKAQVAQLEKASAAHTNAQAAFLEKQKALKAAEEAKVVAEKLLFDLKNNLARTTQEFESTEKAAKQAIVHAKAAAEKLSQSRLLASQSAYTKTETDKLVAEVAAFAARIKADEKTATNLATLAVSTKALAEVSAADAAGRTKSAEEARASVEAAIEDVAAKSAAAAQVKVKYDKVVAETPTKEKEATAQLATATNALASAEKELQKAQQTQSTAEHELKLANIGTKRAVDAVAAAKVALEAAEAQAKVLNQELTKAEAAAANAEKPIRAVALSHASPLVLTGGDDHKVHSWSAETGQPFEIFKGHGTPVIFVAFTGANFAVSAASDGSVILWDLQPAWTLERVIGAGDATSPLADRVSALRFSRDGQVLATGGGAPTRGGEIKLWDVSTGKLIRELNNVHSDAVLSLDFSPNGKMLASGAADKFAKVTEIELGKVIKTFEGHTHHVLGVSWKRDGRTVTTSGADNLVKVWDFSTGQRKKNIEGFGKEVTAISFISGTDQMVVASGDSQVRAVKESGETVRSFAGASDFLHSAAVTPDGKVIIAGGQDSILRVWNGTNAEPMASFESPK